MNFRINGNELKYEAEVRAAAKPRVFLNGQEIPVDCELLPDGHYSVILNGRVFDFLLQLNGQSCVVMHRGGHQTLRIDDSRCTDAPEHFGDPGNGIARVCSEMPGKVIRVLVQVGSPVTQGQTLLVLEAMKMQNEIRAPKSGMVRDIASREGKTVNAGEYLVSIE